MNETAPQNPFLHTAAERLKVDGSFTQHLDERETADIMLGVVESLLPEGNEVSNLRVTIRDNKVTVEATVKGKRFPAGSYVIDVAVVLKNTEQQGHLQLASLDMKKRVGGLLVDKALKGIEKSARTKLEDPNGALKEVLEKELIEEGAELIGVNMDIFPDTLALDLVGKAAPAHRPVITTAPIKKPAAPRRAGKQKAPTGPKKEGALKRFAKGSWEVLKNRLTKKKTLTEKLPRKEGLLKRFTKKSWEISQTRMGGVIQIVSGPLLSALLAEPISGWVGLIIFMNGIYRTIRPKKTHGHGHH